MSKKLFDDIRARVPALAAEVKGRLPKSLDELKANLPTLGEIKAKASNLRLVDFDDIDNRYLAQPPRIERCLAPIRQSLARARLTGGRMLEIGGRNNPLKEHFPEFEYHALDLSPDVTPGLDVIVADITACPEIPSGSFDLIISVDVFEHIDKPWLAAAEISRLLKPGGVTGHSTLFSWRYHPCPIDYWRFTPEALKSLFPELKPLHAEFDYAERRRNVDKVSRRGAPPDELGGWRENVRVHYVGFKPVIPLNSPRRLRKTARA